jgi:hypothetical protein
MHKTEERNIPKTEPAKCLHCVEINPANYKGCKVYQEIIRNKFPSSKPIIETHRATTSSTQENTCANTPRQSVTRLEALCTQIVRNNQTPTIVVPNNTQEDTLPKIIQTLLHAV